MGKTENSIVPGTLGLEWGVSSRAESWAGWCSQLPDQLGLANCRFGYFDSPQPGLWLYDGSKSHCADTFEVSSYVMIAIIFWPQLSHMIRQVLQMLQVLFQVG